MIDIKGCQSIDIGTNTNVHVTMTKGVTYSECLERIVNILTDKHEHTDRRTERWVKLKPSYQDHDDPIKPLITCGFQ